MYDTAASVDFPIHDSVGAWVPHGRFILRPTHHGVLDGLRFGVKDLFDVAGHPTGAGNPTWQATHPLPRESSPLVSTLLGAGATLVGKLVTDELAYSINGDNIHYGTPVNSRAPERVPGGSSSGSAAAVAAGLCDFALASDTGGSTRVPASYCGLWGLRTTHGLVRTSGMVPLHPSFDTATWLARKAEVFERVGQVLLRPGGFSPERVVVIDEAAALADPVFAQPLARVAEVAAALLERAVEHVDIVPAGQTLDDWRGHYVTAGAHEGWQIHGGWIRSAKPDFGPAIAERWAAAAQVTDAAAREAWEAIDAIRARIDQVLDAATLAILPSAAGLAPERDATGAAVDALRRRTLQITCIAGIGGRPQVSIPLQSPEGVPLGISLLGPARADAALIALALRIAQALPAGLRCPE
jgi:amidase